MRAGCGESGGGRGGGRRRALTHVAVAPRRERRAGALKTLPDPCTAAHGDVPYASLSAIITVIRVSRNMVIGWDGLAGAHAGAAASSTLFLPITEFTAPDARASDPWVHYAALSARVGGIFRVPLDPAVVIAGRTAALRAAPAARMRDIDAALAELVAKAAAAVAAAAAQEEAALGNASPKRRHADNALRIRIMGPAATSATRAVVDTGAEERAALERARAAAAAEWEEAPTRVGDVSEEDCLSEPFKVRGRRCARVLFDAPAATPLQRHPTGAERLPRARGQQRVPDRPGAARAPRRRATARGGGLLRVRDRRPRVPPAASSGGV